MAPIERPARRRALAISAGAVALVVLLAACSSLDNTKAEHARTALIGMKRGDLMACAGQPYATAQKRDGKKRLLETITYRRAFYEKTEKYGSRLRTCNAAFSLTEGRVTRLDYSGTSGGTVFNRYHLCLALVERCMKEFPVKG